MTAADTMPTKQKLLKDIPSKHVSLSFSAVWVLSGEAGGTNTPTL